MKDGFVRNAAALVNIMLMFSLVFGLFGNALAAEEAGCANCGHYSISESERIQFLKEQPYTVPSASPPNLKMQLGLLLDGSSSITTQNWNIMLTGLSNVIKSNAFPKDGSVELTVVQFGVSCPSGSGAEVEIEPTIITANNYQQIASSIMAIPYGDNWTPLPCGLNLLADTMFISPNFNPNLKQIVNIITDGEPNRCCNSSYCEDPTIICDANNESVEARNYLISKLQLTPIEDRITCEFIGNNDNFRDWIENEIVWPQPGAIAPPYPPNNGWVRMIASYKDLEEAIEEKIKVIIPPTPPSNKTSDINYDSIVTGNEKSRAIGWDDASPFRHDSSSKALNNLEILKNQNVGPCESCCKQNNSSTCASCSEACTTVNREQIKIGDMDAQAFGFTTAKNSIKVVVAQGP
jgi:hypothetical protein